MTCHTLCFKNPCQMGTLHVEKGICLRFYVIIKSHQSIVDTSNGEAIQLPYLIGVPWWVVGSLRNIVAHDDFLSKYLIKTPSGCQSIPVKCPNSNFTNNDHRTTSLYPCLDS